MRLALLLLTLLASPLTAQAAARYYFVILDVQGADGAAQADPSAKLARQVFLEELGKRPEVTLTAEGLPKEAAALREELKRRKLKGYQLTLRLLHIGRSLNPPPRGKQFQVLERSVKLTVLGTTLPDSMLAVGGDGESTVQADVGARITPKQEDELLRDALRDAIVQAVTQTVRKLDLGGKVPPPEKPRKKR